MPICSTCSTRLTTKSPGLRCAGACGSYYHGKCLGISSDHIASLQLPGAVWFCPRCRSDADTPHLSPARSTVAAIVDDDCSQLNADSDSSRTLKIVESIQAQMITLNRNHTDVMESVNFCSDKVTSFEEIIKGVNERLKVIEKLSQENIQLKAEVKVLNTRVEVLEQQARANNLEVQGVPEKQGENLLSIIKKIGDFIECPITSDEIDTVFRARSRNTNSPKPIVVRFSSKKKRDDILTCAKSKRKATASPTTGLQVENVSSQLFINEHLTASTKTLLMKTKEMTRMKNYKYTWIRDGNVFVRKIDQSRVVRISSLEDIERL